MAPLIGFIKHMQISNLLRTVVLLTAGFYAPLLHAAEFYHPEDIDVYADGGSAAPPNIIIVLDSSANWSSSIPVGNCYYKEWTTNAEGVAVLSLTSDGPPSIEQGKKMAIEKCALYNLINALPTGASGQAFFNVGLMLFNESPASISGGYPRFAVKPLTAANKTALKNLIKSLSWSDDKGNNAAFAKSLYEAYLNLTGAVPYRGTSGSKWDTAATVGGSATGNYNPPGLNSCGKNYIVFIANGGPGENTDGEAKAKLKTLLTNAGMTDYLDSSGEPKKIEYATSYVKKTDADNWSDEFARFMFSADASTKEGRQPIVTYAIAVVGHSSDGLYPNFMHGIAKEGGSTRAIVASDADTLERELSKIFYEIQGVESVFAAASLPISVNARGTYLNQIFMGMFLPDAVARPRWNGNLKQYQFSFDPQTNSLTLADQNGNPAIAPATGFISPNASSFWTRPSSFWINAQSGTPPSASDDPDGAVIAKGAAAQVLRTSFSTDADRANRVVYTCLECTSATALRDSTRNSFAVGNTDLDASTLNVADATERSLLIEWVRGANNKVTVEPDGTILPDERGPGAPITVRPSIHGDVLHSRPAAVNYGGDDVVVFYGANDGMLHAVVGNQTGTDAGKTLWSFVPTEFLGKLKRLRNNAPVVAFPNLEPLPVGSTERTYFVDGSISIYQKWNNDGTLDKVYLYATMRRGGRFVYAFDVTTPSTPKFLWKLAPTSDVPLGQTWSEARVAKLRGHSNPVIVMGGGYDSAAEDTDPPGTTTMGNFVVVVDAFTGEVVRKLTGVDRSMPADISLIDTDLDGYVDRGYAADLGGNLYRLDFEIQTGSSVNVSKDDWTLTKLASLGSSGGTKFFYAPDVVATREFVAILAGTGDREKPRDNSTSDYFFTVLDTNLSKGMPAAFTPYTFADLTDGATFASSATRPAGCYLAMNTAGEKVVNAPLTIGGTTYFGTNMPRANPENSCSSNLGLAKIYALPLLCRTPEVTELTGGGLPPSPVGGVVEVQYTRPNCNGPDCTETRQLPFIIGSGARGSPIEGEKVTLPVTPRRTRRYWFNETGD